MDIQPLHRQVNAAELPPEKLAGNTQISEAEKVAELCRQFEALLLRQILKDAQKTVIKSDLTCDAAGDDIYRDMITSQLAETISQSGSFGFAHALEKELTRQLLRPHPDQTTPLEN